MNIKKIIIGAIICTMVVAASLVGLKLYMVNSRPDLNGNEKIVSTALKVDGTPKDILGDAKEITVSRDTSLVYLSIPVNSNNMTTCHVILTFGDEKLEDTTITISDARYVTYCFDDLENRKSGLYQFAFYDSNNELNVYATIRLE